MKSINAKSKNTAMAILWLVLSCTVHILLFRSRIDMDIPVYARLLSVILGVAVTLFLHEIVHCVFMMLVGLKDVGLEFGKDPLGIPSLRAVARGKTSGGKRIIFLLAPFLLLTLVPDVLFLLNSRVRFLFFVIALCNAAGCYFDVADVIAEIKAGHSEKR